MAKKKDKETGFAHKYCFYLNGELHRRLHINRAMNTVHAYSFVEHKVKVYPWSEVQRNKGGAFTVLALSRMLNRSTYAVRKAMWEDKNIRLPQYAYYIPHGPDSRPTMYLFSEDDAMEARDFFASRHIGRPRKDGRRTNNSIPSREDFRAMMQSNKLIYVKEKGKFIPVWRASDW